MGSYMQITVLLLCSTSWSCRSETMEVLPGENITLFCTNISESPTQTDWFRIINRTKLSCISSIYDAGGDASYCDGFHNKKFKMSSNMTSVFLQIKQADQTDSGLYFCGFYIKAHTVIGSETELIIKGNEDSDVQGECNNNKEDNQLKDKIPGILGALSVLLFMAIIVLAVKNKRHEKASMEMVQRIRNENPNSDDYNYAALSFQGNAKRSHRSVPLRKQETHVVYAATR